MDFAFPERRCRFHFTSTPSIDSNFHTAILLD
jgi:hypothetical protein